MKHARFSHSSKMEPSEDTPAEDVGDREVELAPGGADVAHTLAAARR